MLKLKAGLITGQGFFAPFIIKGKITGFFQKKTNKLHGTIGVNIMQIASNGEIFDPLHSHVKIEIFSFPGFSYTAFCWGTDCPC
jgi:hypothetical protein